MEMVILGALVAIYGYFTGASLEELKTIFAITMVAIILQKLNSIEQLIKDTEIKVEVREISEEEYNEKTKP